MEREKRIHRDVPPVSAHRSVTKPKCLAPGDRIALMAPSGPLGGQEITPEIARLQALGYDVMVPEEINASDGYLAGSDAQRAGLINRLFSDDRIRGVLAVRGGYGALRILSRLDFDSIRSNPKIVLGSSDVTALMSALHQQCRLVTLHGPMLASLASSDARSWQALAEALSGVGQRAFVPEQPVVISPGDAVAPITGGNLCTLCHLLGTPFEPSFDGCVLLLEDCCEAPYRIDRMLTQMAMAGKFRKVRGVVLGDFTDCGSLELIHRVVASIFVRMGIPVLAGFPFGHGSRKLTIPLGVKVALQTSPPVLRVLESPFLEA